MTSVDAKSAHGDVDARCSAAISAIVFAAVFGFERIR